MNSKFLFGLALVAFSAPVSALETNLPSDSLALNIQEIVVTKSLRENAFVKELPVSSTVLSGVKMAAENHFDLKSVAAQVPNLFIPDYGSKLTSAIYLRGIGSRMNASVVGFYVDDVPYLDKSAFDFEWQDIQRMEVLRGPQGTLYGRNAMGGVIHLHTFSPFENLGTTLRLSYGSYNDLHLQASHSQKINEQYAFSLAGNYHENKGFFTNVATGDKVGATQTASVRGKLAARYANGWKADLSAAYEYTNQDGYAYSPISSDTISYNDESSYRRNLLTAGLTLAKETANTSFHSVTGYQNFKDALKLDQDFSTASLFTLHQNQDFNALTQEFVYKSANNNPLQWVFGAFGSASLTETSAPVQFKQDGIVSMLENNINRGIPASLAMSVDITDNVLDIPSDFNEHRQTAALYHQLSYQLPFVKGLSITGGLRLEYERVQLNWNSSADMNYLYTMVNHGVTLGESLTANALLKGEASKSYMEVTPKIALEYAFNPKNKVYASLTRGHQSGGYNVQLFSDLIQTELQAVMSQQMKTSMTSQLQALVAYGMPQASVDAIVSHIPTSKNVENVSSILSYDPEYSWNYEIGFHSEPVSDRLQVDGALFYVDCYNRQIAQFSPSGLGRMMKNAGKSYSKGFEISVLAKVLSNLDVRTSYGFTEAKFTQYSDSLRVNGVYAKVDYAGKSVPMIPKHTLSVGADYSVKVRSSLLDKVILSAQYQANGPIYWTEKNDVQQAFSGVADGQLALVKGSCQLQMWVKNAFSEKYRTFYFESMGKAFAQQNRPRQIGATIQYKF